MIAEILCRARRRTVFVPRSHAELRAYAECEIDPLTEQMADDLRRCGRIAPARLRAFEAAVARVRASMAAMLEQNDMQPPGAA